MYESYWQLDCNPFDANADEKFFFGSETHQASLLKMRYLIENRKGAGVLVGGTGSGKTFLTQILAQQLAESHGPFVHIVFPQLSAAELLAYLAVELGANPQQVGSEDGGLDRTLREIERLLGEFGDQGKHPVIIIDEAHLIDDPLVFQALRLLLNFQQHNRTQFTMIFVGQRELLCELRRIQQLEERLAVKCLLRPLTEDETVSYVSCRLQAAGAAKPIFDPEAMFALFELSGGVPRRINRICDLALLVGYADESTSITSRQIEAVSEELTAAVPD
jgi:type II secretory pathway predicted ATPase ExeA